MYAGSEVARQIWGIAVGDIGCCCINKLTVCVNVTQILYLKIYKVPTVLGIGMYEAPMAG